MLLLGRVWSRGSTALPHKKGGESALFLSSVLWAALPWRETVCLSLALNLLPFYFFVILNYHCRGFSSRHCVRRGKPSGLSRQRQQWRCQVSQGWWCLPKLNSPTYQTLGTCLQPKVKTDHVFRGAIFPHPIHSMTCFKGGIPPYTYVSFFLHHHLCFYLPPFIPILCLAILPRMTDILSKVIFLCCGA